MTIDFLEQISLYVRETVEANDFAHQRDCTSEVSPYFKFFLSTIPL